MKRILFFTMFFTIIGSAFSPVFGAVVDTTKISVSAGDKRTWEITKWITTGDFVGFLGDVETGDTFSLEVVSVTLDSDNSIEIIGTDPDGTVGTDRVDLDVYDSDLVFTDWVYWKEEMEADGYTIVEDSDTFERSISTTQTYVAGDFEFDYFGFFQDSNLSTY